MLALTKVLGFSVCFLLIATVFGVVLPMDVSAQGACPEGMVSYWRFDEGSGTIAYDSVDDNSGIIKPVSPQWTTDSISGSALQFSGVNDWVSTDVSTYSEMTKIGWIKTIASSGYILGPAEGKYHTYHIGLSNGKLYYQHGDNHLIIQEMIHQGKQLLPRA